MIPRYLKEFNDLLFNVRNWHLLNFVNKDRQKSVAPSSFYTIMDWDTFSSRRAQACEKMRRMCSIISSKALRLSNIQSSAYYGIVTPSRAVNGFWQEPDYVSCYLRYGENTSVSGNKNQGAEHPFLVSACSVHERARTTEDWPYNTRYLAKKATCSKDTKRTKCFYTQYSTFVAVAVK